MSVPDFKSQGHLHVGIPLGGLIRSIQYCVSMISYISNIHVMHVTLLQYAIKIQIVKCLCPTLTIAQMLAESLLEMTLTFTACDLSECVEIANH